MYNDDSDFWKGILGIIAAIGLFVGLVVAVVNAPPSHHHHYKHQVFKLKGGRYAYKDHKGQWWQYKLKALGKALTEADIPDIALPDSDFAQPWTTSTGSLRLPMGGVWEKSQQPQQEEIESEMEASIEETAEGPETDGADTGADADSAGDGSDAGSGDGGGDGGDGGGDGGGGE
jgi:hypothetical protein